LGRRRCQYRGDYTPHKWRRYLVLRFQFTSRACVSAALDQPTCREPAAVSHASIKQAVLCAAMRPAENYSQKERRVKTISKAVLATVLCFVATSPLYAQGKDDGRLAKSATVLEAIVNDSNMPVAILNQAECVLVFPSVKKVAVGIGASWGKGALVCRTGADHHGQWGAPVMYKLDSGSLGVQLGSTATDYVLAVMNQKGADQILNAKTKLGADANATAGPTGAQAQGYNAHSMNVDVLTYSRSKGLFAGVSLAGASMEPDDDGNKALYGPGANAASIVGGKQPMPAGAAPLVDYLNKTSPTFQ
jgi:lipid-binding SYLF domain-containing protein